MGLVSALYLAFWAVLLHFVGDELSGPGSDFAARFLTQSGFQFSSMLIALLTIMLGAGTVSADLESGVAHAILARPIRRAEYILGKLAGLSVLACLCATVLYALLLGIGAAYGLGPVLALSLGQILGAWAVYLLVPVAVLCATIYGSVSLRTVPNGLFMIFIYILGNIGGMVEMVGGLLARETVTATGVFISLISPFHTLYTTAERILLPAGGLMDELARGAGGLTGAGAPPSALMYVYIGVYMVGLAALAVQKFGRKDIV